ncbi:T9SS type A sorting domain-containing protein [Tenacibaculum sp. MAR_2009_124]|uniref:T9SS type A sorting domain-containing protein n=1 Tax=Tenacibaculum sp. MAR_2009_124 TaxID=1250059 RepID=UPI0015A1A5E5|nr:T9SS type A sorting domain-containing protein [Tenacibaculum sp. MAR_2009_124]
MICLYTSINFAQEQSKKVEIGTPKDILDLCTFKNSKNNLNRQIKFKLTDNHSIPISLKDYYYENGEMSLNGTIEKNEKSVFILRGNQNNIYGYALDQTKSYGYEYTTNKTGKVTVQKVPSHKLVSVCNFNNPQHQHHEHSKEHIGNYPGTDVRKLQSLPGAPKVMYIDLREIMNGANPKYGSKEDIWKVYQCLASALSAFNVNVTTDHSLYTATPVVNSGIAQMKSQTGRSYAYLNSFGTSRPSIIYRETNPKFYGLTLAHEVGHQLGLSHDRGTPGGEYYQGLPEFQWVPIMGNYYFSSSWGNPLFQYSKGEYNTATNKENDLTLIRRYLSYRQDDNSQGKALQISNGTVNQEKNKGLIETNSDTDRFNFSIGSSGGKINLSIKPIEYITFLDINARIENSNGATVAQSNPKRDRKANFNQNLPSGNYTLIIESGSEGTPSNGFSRYSSLGWYGISGSITGTSNGTNPTITFSTPTNNQVITLDQLKPVSIQINVTNTGSSSYSSTINVDNQNFNGTSASWTPSKYGNFTIKGTATTTTGKTGSSTINITIKEPNNNPPSITIISPNNGQVFEQTTFQPITISCNISDPDGDSTTTEINVGGQTFNSSTAQWTPSNYGNFTIRFRTTDSKGASSEKTVQIQVKNPSTGSVCDNIEEWKTSKTYKIRDKVVYQNTLYEAIWWSRYAFPNIYTQVWKRIGSCNAALIATTLVGNPINNSLSLRNRVGSIKIYNQSGNYIDDIKHDDKDIRHYQPGVYFIRIGYKGQTKMIKFIKK